MYRTSIIAVEFENTVVGLLERVLMSTVLRVRL